MKQRKKIGPTQISETDSLCSLSNQYTAVFHATRSVAKKKGAEIEVACSDTALTPFVTLVTPMTAPIVPVVEAKSTRISKEQQREATEASALLHSLPIPFVSSATVAIVLREARVPGSPVVSLQELDATSGSDKSVRRKNGKIEVDKIPIVLNVVTHKDCNLFSTVHGQSGKCKEKAREELRLKGIIVTMEMLEGRVNKWIDLFEANLTAEETGNPGVVFQGNDVQLQMLSEMRKAKIQKKVGSVTDKQEEAEKKQGGADLRKSVASGIELIFSAK